jgi:nucleoside recognition membrane protein YjiH
MNSYCMVAPSFVALTVQFTEIVTATMTITKLKKDSFFLKSNCTNRVAATRQFLVWASQKHQERWENVPKEEEEEEERRTLSMKISVEWARNLRDI